MSGSEQARKPTLDQRRAAYAWKQVQGCDKEYAVLAKGAGALVMGNGLMATLAFYQSKGKEHHLALNDHIMDWLQQQDMVEGRKFAAVMPSLHSSSSAKYRRATQETLDLLRWVRQFASAVNNAQGD